MPESVEVIDMFTQADNMREHSEGNILYAEDVYVKCWAWETILPIASQELGGLDIFEQTVLQLAALHRVSLEKLAEETCLAQDFLKTILSRLVEKKFLGITGEITKEGKAYLSQKSEDSTEVEDVQLLMLPDTGQLLQVIVSAEKDENQKNGQLQGRLLKVDEKGTSKGEAAVPKRYPVWVPQSRKDAKEYRSGLTQGWLQQFIREYNSGHAAERRKLDRKRSIRVSNYPHEVYLHAIVKLQRGMIDIPLVDDSGVYGNDQTLALYARQYQREALAGIRRKADEGATKQGKARSGNRPYADIHQLMESVDASSVLAKDLTEDERRECTRKKEDNLKNIYRAVELAFTYYLQMYPLTKERQHTLVSMNVYENRRYITSTAKAIGFQVGQEAKKLFGQLDRSRIEAYYTRRTPNLYTVLPLALASTNDRKDSTLWHVAHEMPELLPTIAWLTESSQFRHGSAESRAEDNAAYQHYSFILMRIKRFLELLLPGYVEKPEVRTGETETDASSLLLHAEDMAVSLLGPECYGSLNKNMQDDILAVTAKYNDIDLAPVDFISNLSKILENFYRSAVSTQDHLARTNRDVIVQHLEESLGGADVSWKLPEELATVRRQMVVAASKGENATLGAYALVYFGNMERDQLAQATEDISCTAEILKYRQHDNNLHLELSKTKLKKLRNDVFMLIRRRYED